MGCETCNHYRIKEMINSGKPFGYSGAIPCYKCDRYIRLEDKHTNPGANSEIKKIEKIINAHQESYAANKVIKGGVMKKGIEKIIREFVPHRDAYIVDDLVNTIDAYYKEYYTSDIMDIIREQKERNEI